MVSFPPIKHSCCSSCAASTPAPAGLGFLPVPQSSGFNWSWLLLGAAVVGGVWIWRRDYSQSRGARLARAGRKLKGIKRGLARDRQRFEQQLEALRIP
jgi:hypothetical protein